MVNFYNYTGSNFVLKKSVQIQFSAFTFLCILVESIMFVIHKLWSRQVFQKHLSVVTVVTLRFDFLYSFMFCTHCYAFQVQRYLSQHFFFCIRFIFLAIWFCIIFIHLVENPEIPLANQSPDWCMWARREFSQCVTKMCFYFRSVWI